MTSTDAESSSSDWDSRALCADDSCLGVLGSDALCAVCGRRGELVSGGLEVAAHLSEVAVATSASPATPLLEQSAHLASSDDEFEGRRLCPDDGCIGVLGSDGACKTCGARVQ